MSGTVDSPTRTERAGAPAPDAPDGGHHEELPLVDLAGFIARRTDYLPVRADHVHADDANTAQALCHALERFGFVRLIGHGVAQSAFDRVDSLFEEFFAWPEARKQRVSGVAGGQRGYTPFGREHARDRATPDPKAFYHVGQPAPRGASAASYPMNVFPDDFPALEAASLELFAGLEQASLALLAAIEIGWQLEPHLLSGMITGGNSILRALHYPALDPDAFAGECAAAPGLLDAGGELAVLRAAPHEDINLVTLLPASGVPGLEILRPEAGTARSRWLAITTGPGELVADVGDMLARLTGGLLPATTHRVVATTETAKRSRRTYPFFAHPRPECDLAVHPAFAASGPARAWPAITAGEFLAERLREIGLDD